MRSSQLLRIRKESVPPEHERNGPFVFPHGPLAHKPPVWATKESVCKPALIALMNANKTSVSEFRLLLFENIAELSSNFNKNGNQYANNSAISSNSSLDLQVKVFTAYFLSLLPHSFPISLNIIFLQQLRVASFRGKNQSLF